MNKIFKKWLDKQPPLSVNPLHNGQYYLTDEQALDFAKMYHSEQLLIHSVVVTSCCKGTGVIKDEDNDECYCDCEIGTNLMKQQY